MHQGRNIGMAIISLILSFLCATSFGNLVTNGDFETGDLTGWTLTPTANAEPEMDPKVVPFETKLGINSYCFEVNPGNDRGVYPEFEEGINLSQAIHVTAGQQYHISFDAAIRNMSSVYVNGQGGIISLFLADELLWTWSVGDINPSEVIRNSCLTSFTPLSSGEMQLRFLCTRHSRNYTPAVCHYLDNIEVVPEPATMILLSLGGLAAFRRRRK